MLPKDITDKIKVKITVGNPDTGRSFNFSGNLASYETNIAQVVQDGNFLHLHDSHVKPLKVTGQSKANILFNYSIEVTTEVYSQNSILKSLNNNTGFPVTASLKRKYVSKKDNAKLPKLAPILDPKPVASFNVIFDTNNINDSSENIGAPKLNVKVKMEPTEFQLV